MNEYEDSFAWAEPLLRQGERVLWQGRPERVKIIRKADFALIPFSFAWCGFALFWEYNAIVHGAPIFMALFGVPFVIIGLYISVGRLIMRGIIMKRTAYVITTQKILRRQNTKIDMQNLDSLPRLAFEMNDDGTGTIFIGESAHLSDRRAANSWFLLTDPDFTLREITDIQGVLGIIETAQAKLTRDEAKMNPFA